VPRHSLCARCPKTRTKTSSATAGSCTRQCNALELTRELCVRTAVRATAHVLPTPRLALERAFAVGDGGGGVLLRVEAQPQEVQRMQKVATIVTIVTLEFRVGGRSRGRFATPADFPRHDGTPYRGLRVRRWGLGFFHHSRTIFCRAVPNLSVTIRNFFIAAGGRGAVAAVAALAALGPRRAHPRARHAGAGRAGRRQSLSPAGESPPI
jgi:hypothetical protein